MSIRIRVFVTIMLAAITIIGFGIGTGLIFVRGHIEESIENDMAAVANISDELISGKINLLKANAATTAQVLANCTPENVEAMMQVELAYYKDFQALALFTRNGVFAQSGDSPASAELLNDENMQKAFDGQNVISTTFYDANGNLVMHVLVPSGSKVLAVTISGFYFSDLVSHLRVWETGNVFIVDADGFVLANIRQEWVQERWNYIEMAKADSQYLEIAQTVDQMVKGTSGVGRFSIAGVERICVYKPVSGSQVGWSMGVVAPLDESPLDNMNKGLILVGIVCLVLSLIAAFGAAMILGKPYLEIKRLVVSLEKQSEDLDKARAEAVASTEAKSNFLANVSHEMRTPLNAIIGLSELTLDADDLNSTAQENLEKVYNSGVTLLSLINDILDVSKIESGKFELIPAEYDTPSLINDTTTLNVVRIGSKPIDFILDIDENLPNRLWGDELRIKQVFNNLLSNAFKYTQAGKVIWSISTETGEDTGELWLVSSVHDTGSGIKPEDMEKLFSEYNQVDNKSNKQIEGTGLGLSICKSMVEMMDGTITAQSEFGVGSTFTVRFKQGRINDQVIGPEVADGLRNFHYSNSKRDRSSKLVRACIPYAKVLVVDDVSTNLDVAKGMMKPYGMQIDSATSGYQAVAAVREQKVSYNAIFMDHMMPGMDGIEATRIIREEIDTEYARNIPIIALTANAIVGNEEMFLNNGFQAFLTKPIDIMRMDYVINHWVRDKEYEQQLGADADTDANAPEPEADVVVDKASDDDRRALIDANFEGFDFDNGLARFTGDLDTYLEVVTSFVNNTPSLLEQIANYQLGDNPDYAIVVHGIKSSSRSIGAVAVGTKAEELEHAANADDSQFILAENQGFLRQVEQLITDLSGMLQKCAEQNPKELKPAPDPEVLAKLVAACNDYDIDAVDAAMDELERYSYQTDADLIDWLKSKILVMEFDEIQERLAER